ETEGYGELRSSSHRSECAPSANPADDSDDDSYVDRRAKNGFHGLVCRFSQCGMRVNGMHQVLNGAFQCDGGHGFGNHFRNRTPDHVNAENFAVFGIGYDLHKTIAGVFDLRLADGGEGKLSGRDVVAGLLSPGFRETDAGDLRIAIGARGYPVVIDRDRMLAGNSFDCNDSFLHGDVSKQW